MNYVIKKGFLMFTAAMFCSLWTRAQQDHSSLNYVYDAYHINPAYAGYHMDPVVNFSAMGFLENMEGAPRTLSFSAHGKALNPKVAFGAHVFNDQIGVTSTNGIYGSYSYKLIARNRNSYSSWEYNPHVLAFGISAGVSFYKENLQSLNMGNDPHFQENVSLALPNFGVGIYYSKNKFFAGLSVPEILNNWRDDKVMLSRHFYLNAGYQIVTGRSIKIQFNSLLKYVDGAPLQIDGNATLDFKEKLNFGIGYRSASSLNFLLGLHVARNFQVRYFYLTNVGSHSDQINFNNHEIVLSYRFASTK